MKQRIRNIIIGKNTYIESWNEFRQVLLSGQYALISFIVLGFYFVKDISKGEPQMLLALGFGLMVIPFTIFLHRRGHHCISNYLLFTILNLIIFLIGSSESLDTGAFFFFIPLGLGSMAVFNYRERSTALYFSVFSILLFIIGFSGVSTLIPFRNYSLESIRYAQLINFSLAFPSSLFATWLLISINYSNAKSLVASNQQLVKLNEELDRFVYSTSHDLRAPLLSVKGLLTLAETAQAEDILKYLKMMHSRVDSLDKFIKDITDYSRNNRLEIINEPVFIHELIVEIWDSLRFNQAAKDIDLKIDVPESLRILSDGRRLKIVLSNLISNAINYHDHRKTMRFVRIYHQTSSDSFSIHLEDNGLGIMPQIQHRIFDMFFRGNEKSQGSGLGLYIVKETISKLSGNILLKSVPNEGSTFSIIFPKEVHL